MKAAGDKLSKGAASGMVALVFLVLGFQLAMFVIKIIDRPAAAPLPESMKSEASEVAGGVRSREPFSGERDEHQSNVASRTHSVASVTNTRAVKRSYESFAFDPNTVSIEDLQRLGLSERQAATIENYRAKGGRFRSKADFQKMYVVTDTLFARLEPFIDIPKLELNSADSAALVALRGIGPYYARKILAYRERLGGFYDKSQLLEIEGIDAERYAGLAEEVTVDPAKIRKLDIWNAPDSLLASHPYLGQKGARSIVRYRQLYDTTRRTVADLETEHVLLKENIEKLKKYIDNQ